MRQLQCMECEAEFSAKSRNSNCPVCGSSETIWLDCFEDRRHKQRYIQHLKGERRAYIDQLSDAEEEGKIRCLKKKARKKRRELELRTDEQLGESEDDNDRGLGGYK